MHATHIDQSFENFAYIHCWFTFLIVDQLISTVYNVKSEKVEISVHNSKFQGGFFVITL